MINTSTCISHRPLKLPCLQLNSYLPHQIFSIPGLTFLAKRNCDPSLSFLLLLSLPSKYVQSLFIFPQPGSSTHHILSGLIWLPSNWKLDVWEEVNKEHGRSRIDRGNSLCKGLISLPIRRWAPCGKGFWFVLFTADSSECCPIPQECLQYYLLRKLIFIFNCISWQGTYGLLI